MSTTPLLEARKLCSGYAGVEIVRDLTLEVRPGEVVALASDFGVPAAEVEDVIRVSLRLAA